LINIQETHRIHYFCRLDKVKHNHATVAVIVGAGMICSRFLNDQDVSKRDTVLARRVLGSIFANTFTFNRTIFVWSAKVRVTADPTFAAWVRRIE